MNLTLPGQVCVVGSGDRDLESMLAAAGLRPTAAATADLASLAHPSAHPAPVLVVDLRGGRQFPPALSDLKRAHPRTAIVLVVGAPDTSLMLEAIRCGVTECVVEPLREADLLAAVRRMGETEAAPGAGQVFGIVGAKGGVGTTTVAVNIATELARVAPGQTLLVDLHLSHGDAAVMLGVEPRFSVVDALQNTHRLDESVLRGLVTKTAAGVDLLASSDTWTAATPVEGVTQLIALTARLYRYVVLDLPRAGSWTIDALGDLTRVVVVANQEVSTVRHASNLVATLQRRCGRERVSVVVSRFDPQSGIRRQDIEQVIKQPISHVVPSDYRLALRAQHAGRPLSLDNHSRLAASFRELSRDLAGIKPPPAAAAGASSLFGLLTGRRS
jgi:pilus assembly protein CpaE